MDSRKHQKIAELKHEIEEYEKTENRLQEDLVLVREKKKIALEKLRELSSDEKYQQDVLAQVYAQRQQKK